MAASGGVGTAQPNEAGTTHQQRGGALARLRRASALRTSGLIAALVIGAAALFAGAGWAVLLVVFFAAATAVSRFKRREKIDRAGSFIEKTGPRDAVQVIANGAVFALGALLFGITGEQPWAGFAAGALAAASADTWATELGLLSPNQPRSIVSGRRVPPGASGGVTLAGTIAGVMGALVVSATGSVLGLAVPGAAALFGGIAGMTVDSLMGATIQERRWCPGCARPTERRTHACGRATERRGGIPGLGNDLVNGLATLVGALIGAGVVMAGQ